MILENEMPVQNQKSIFIHSLFRAGSTYVFNVFRRSENGYWCYQEPLHELAFWAQGNKEKLLEVDGGTATTLRHPQLERPYFFELYEVADKCLSSLKKNQIYDAYFPDGCEDFGLNFFSSLIDAARGTAVIQECRTSMRIHALKSNLGGFHLYLWRNPWDQWWSYKVDDFFDLKSQLFINGKTFPEIVRRLRQEIGFSGFDSDDLQQQFTWFWTNRLSPENNYLIFYTLWLLGLQHGAENADTLVNIDRLSDDHDYRQEITDELEKNGLGGLNFSDCGVPQACYGQNDRAFFERIEDKAHGLFLLSGTPQEVLSKLLDLRHSAAPQAWRNAGTHAVASNLIRDAERARALVRRVEQREVDLRSDLTQQIRNHAQQAAIAESKAREEADRAVRAEERIQHAEECAQRESSRAADLEQQVEVQSRRAVAAEVEAAEQEYRAGLAQTFIEDLELRIIEAETRTVGLDARVEEVQRDVVELATRQTPVREIQLDELKRRVVAALMQVRDVEQRAIAAEARVGQLEYQIFEAEGRAAASEISKAAAEASTAAYENRAVLAESHAQSLHAHVVGLEAQIEDLGRRAAEVKELEGRAEGLQSRLIAAESRSEELVRRAARAEATVEEIERKLASVDLQRQRDAALVGALRVRHDELQRTLAAAHDSVQYWRAESERWHERILSLQHSNSWRVTAPVRAVKRVATGDFSPVRRVAGFVTKGVRRALRPPAVLAARVMLQRPATRYKISTALRKYPALRQHLVLFVRNAGLIADAGGAVHHSLAAAESVLGERVDLGVAAELDPSNLSADARAIYATLKVAIERKKGQI